MKPVGEKIKQIRKSKGISQTVVADICGIKQSSYANIESGKTQTISIEVGKGIAKALKVPFGELFEIEGSKTVDSDLDKKVKILENQIKKLEENLEEKAQIIKLLKNENKAFYKEKSALELERDFYEFWDREIEIENAENDLIRNEAKKRRNYMVKILSWNIKEIIDFGLLSRFEILELIYENDIGVTIIFENADKSENEKEKEFTEHLNNFLKIDIKEVREFLNLYDAKYSSSG